MDADLDEQVARGEELAEHAGVHVVADEEVRIPEVARRRPDEAPVDRRELLGRKVNKISRITIESD